MLSIQAKFVYSSLKAKHGLEPAVLARPCPASSAWSWLVLRSKALGGPIWGGLINWEEVLSRCDILEKKMSQMAARAGPSTWAACEMGFGKSGFKSAFQCALFFFRLGIARVGRGRNGRKHELSHWDVFEASLLSELTHDVGESDRSTRRAFVPSPSVRVCRKI